VRNDGANLESYVQYVYESLLNLKDEGVCVSRGAHLRGRSGVFHEVDVYYEFERANIRHRVVIECKDHNRPVTKGIVQEFHSKIIDIGNVIGLIVSRNGFQSGAKELANHYDILTTSASELPGIPHLLALRIESVCLPGPNARGEPFWTLMETENDELTGNYFCINFNNVNSIRYIPLFISKLHADLLLAQRPDRNELVVRGLERQSLRFLVNVISDLGRGKVHFICFYQPPPDPTEGWVGIPKTAEELKREHF
jgi:Restriction endonuclease